jgi:hypothetical protein
VDVERIDKEDPLSPRIVRDGSLDVIDKVRLGPRGTDRGADQFSRDHVQIADQGRGAVTGVFKLVTGHLAGTHRLAGSDPLQGLDAVSIPVCEGASFSAIREPVSRLRDGALADVSCGVSSG